MAKQESAQHGYLRGLDHIVSRMEWYFELPATLSKTRNTGKLNTSPTAHLETHVLDMYQEITLYQINVMCSLYGSHVAVFRGIVGRDDWNGNLQRILDAEKAVKLDLQEILPQKGSPLAQMANDGQTEGLIAIQEIRSKHQANQLNQMAEIDQQLLQQLVLMDPRETKQRFEETLQEGSCRWILDSSEFKEWQDKEDSVLWVKGDPGLGKTMLMTGIINYLEALVTASGSGNLCFQFFQVTNSRANNATVILRGLIYLLVSRQNWLLTYLRPKYSVAGNQLFEDNNAFYALSSIFQDMLHDSRLSQVYLVVDALDECADGLQLLLDLIAQTTRDPVTRVKWIVSSRIWSPIESQMVSIDGCINLTLRRNSKSLSHGVEEYINNRVSQLARETDFMNEMQDVIRTFLRNKNDGTFLWVSLVVSQIQSSKTSTELRRFLDSIDGGGGQNAPHNQLFTVYDQILTDIERLRGSEIARRCLSVISVAALAYTPLHFLELSALTEVEDQGTESPALKQVLDACRSILVLREDFVYLRHLSVREFILQRDLIDKPLVHFNIFSRSLRALSGVLRRNMYNIQHAGTSYVSAKLQTPNHCPLASIRYCSVFWVHHICNAVKNSKQYGNVLSDNGEVFSFLKRHFLHLLESLSLLGRLSEGIPSLRLLLRTTQDIIGPNSQFTEMLIDAERFARSSSWVIERFPLQTYGAALAFCPTHSLIKQLHWQERTPLLKDVKGVRGHWDGCLQILEGHSETVRAVSFSPDGKVLASASSDRSVLIWDTSVGTNIRRLEGHSGSVLDVRFSPNNKSIASASSDKTVCVWDPDTGTKRKSCQGHSGIVRTLRFLPDSTRFVTTSRDNTVLLWDTALVTPEQILSGQTFDVNAAVLSPNSSRIALALGDIVQVYSFPQGTHERTFTGHGSVVYGLEFSPDGLMIASSSHDNTIRLWDIEGDREVTLSGHTGAVFAVSFSSDCQKLASASSDQTIRLWDVAKASHIRTFEGHRGWVNAVAFSPDNKIIASCSHDKTVRLWDAENTGIDVTSKKHKIRTIVFSPDGKKVALISGDWNVQVWDPVEGTHMVSIQCESGIITSITFSPNDDILATVANDKIIRLYGTDDGDLKTKLEGHDRRINAVAFSADGSMLASASNDRTVKLWRTDLGKILRTLRGHLDWVSVVAFAPDPDIVASASSDKTVRLWKGEACLHEIKSTSLPQSLHFSEDGNDLNVGRAWVNVETGATSTCSHVTQLASKILLVDDWITLDGEKVLWLPSDYRPTCSAFHNHLAVLGHEPGSLTFLNFMFD
ncbi:hypothetical protein N7467_007833 [Penicillium canescens]|nr:hypothetical protein N7467_007833 [Penicillium canescens]